MRRNRGRRKGKQLSWYLLIHQLPPRPLYLRAKIRQRLARIGSVPLKKSVYALPRREECLEDFQWVAEEAVAGGGEAFVCEAVFSDPKTDAALVARFRAERDTDYRQLAAQLRKAPPGPKGAAEVLGRARVRFDEVRRTDYFDAREGRAVAALLTRLEGRARTQQLSKGASMARSKLAGRIWTTRRGVKVDRIASAWLVRRFLDPKARFRFVDPAEPPRAGELRFDMVGGDFTHEGDNCTLETLIARARLRDPALSRVAEIVHDIDVKDGKFAHAETAGVERLLAGLFAAHAADAARLERGFALFDELYQAFRGTTAR